MTHKRLNHFLLAIIAILLSVVIIMLSGCVTAVTSSRKQGFNTTNRSFSMIKHDGSELCEEVTLEDVRVIIVVDCSQFAYEPFQDPKKGVAGYATRSNIIYILGKRFGGKVVVNQEVLGHEFNHLLNFQCVDIANPDMLDELGL